MSWSRLFEQSDKSERLLYWVFALIITPSVNLTLDYHFDHLFPPSQGLIGDLGWDINIRTDPGGQISYEVCDTEGYTEDPGTSIKYTEKFFRNALRKILEEAAHEFPERTQEVANVLQKWGL